MLPGGGETTLCRRPAVAVAGPRGRRGRGAPRAAGRGARRPAGSVGRASEDSVSFLSSPLQSEFLQESSLVLAKLHYVEGDYDGALSLYARAGLEDWPLAGAPPYRLRMAAEAYATQGEAARAPAGRAPALLPGPRSLPGRPPRPLLARQLGWPHRRLWAFLGPATWRFPRTAAPQLALQEKYISVKFPDSLSAT